MKKTGFFGHLKKSQFLPFSKKKKLKKKKMKDLKKEDNLDNLDTSFLCTEAFETMNGKNNLMAAILYVICGLFVFLIVRISPAMTYTKSGFVPTSNHPKSIGLQLKLADLQTTHSSVKLQLFTANVSRAALGVVVTGFIKLKKYGQTVREFRLDSNSFLLSNEATTIFDTGHYKIDEVQANIEVNSVDSVFESICFQWVAENASWIYFTLLIRSVVFIMVVSLLVGFKRGLPKQDFEPTYIQSFITRISFILMISFAPVPELLRLFEITKLEPFFDYFDVVSTNLVLAFLIMSAWDLTVHNTDNEAKFVERMTLAVIFVLVVLTIPKGIRFSNEDIQSFLEDWLSLFVILCCTFTLTFVPDRVKKMRPEFACSIVHLFIILPSILSNIYLRVQEEKRPSKIGLLSALFSSLSFVFILFLHWPQEADGGPSMYIAMERDRPKKSKQSSDDDDNGRARARKIVKV